MKTEIMKEKKQRKHKKGLLFVIENVNDDSVVGGLGYAVLRIEHHNGYSTHPVIVDTIRLFKGDTIFVPPFEV